MLCLGLGCTAVDVGSIADAGMIVQQLQHAAQASTTCQLRIASTHKASGAAASLQDMAQAGGDFEIAVSLYILFSKARVPTSVLVEARTNTELKRESAMICADSG